MEGDFGGVVWGSLGGAWAGGRAVGFVVCWVLKEFFGLMVLLNGFEVSLEDSVAEISLPCKHDLSASDELP